MASGMLVPVNGLHRWVEPVNFALVERDARYVERRRQLQVYRDSRLTCVGPSYCSRCGVQRSSASQLCAADSDRESTIGGDLSTRSKRKVSRPIGARTPAETLVRRIHDLPYVPRGSDVISRNGWAPVATAVRRRERHTTHAWILVAVVVDEVSEGNQRHEGEARATLDVLEVRCALCGTTEVFQRQACVSVSPRSPIGRHLTRLRELASSCPSALVGLPSGFVEQRVVGLRASG